MWDRKVWIMEYAPVDIFFLTSGLLGHKKWLIKCCHEKMDPVFKQWTKSIVYNGLIKFQRALIMQFKTIFWHYFSKQALTLRFSFINLAASN